MRLITLVVFVFTYNYVFADRGVKNYITEEISTLYKSSYFYFERDQYEKAANILSNIQPHQNPSAINHYQALNILDHWKNYTADYNPVLEKLVDLGVDREYLYKEVCDHVISIHYYNMYASCAKNHHVFINMVNEQIAAMLNEYYNRKPRQPFYSFTHLANLANESEITGNTSIDNALIKERIKTIISDNNCRSSFKKCGLDVKVVKNSIRKFIYE